MYRSTAILIMKKNYLRIAAGLGIILPACLIATTAEAKTAEAKDLISTEVSVESNSVKDRIAQSFNVDPQQSPFQLVHSNIHANYTIPHTNIQNNYYAGERYVNTHSNTPQKHVDTHSNSNV